MTHPAATQQCSSYCSYDPARIHIQITVHAAIKQYIKKRTLTFSYVIKPMAKHSHWGAAHTLSGHTHLAGAHTRLDATERASVHTYTPPRIGAVCVCVGGGGGMSED